MLLCTAKRTEVSNKFEVLEHTQTATEVLLNTRNRTLSIVWLSTIQRVFHISESSQMVVILRSPLYLSWCNECVVYVLMHAVRTNVRINEPS